MGRRKSELSSAKDMIFKEISLAQNGITVGELERKTGLNRSTVSKIPQTLCKEGKIKNKGTKNKPKYFPVKITIKPADVQAERFAEEIKRVFLSQIAMMPITRGNGFDETGKNLLYNVNRFFQTQFSSDSDKEEHLFELANRLGSSIIYVIIHGIKQLSTISSERKLTMQEKDEIILGWVDTILLNVLKPHVMLSVFRLWFPDYNKHGKKEMRLFYEYDQKTIEELLQAFSRLYPSLNHQLDKLRNSLTTANITDIKNRIESNLEHIGCDGKILPPEIENGLVKMKCSKCDFVDVIPVK